MPIPRKVFGFLIPLVVVLLLGGGVWYKIRKADAQAREDSLRTANASTPAVPPDAPNSFNSGVPVSVVGAPVERTNLIIWVQANGKAAASQQVIVTPEANGRVARVFVRENDAVRKGDTLIMLDTLEMSLDLQQARLNHRNAYQNYNNDKLLDSRITDPAVKARRDSSLRVKHRLEEADLQLRRAELAFSKAATQAPITGRVANVRVMDGQRTSGELMTIVALNPIRVEAAVLQSEISKVARGNKARLKFASTGDKQFEGTVESINPFVDAQYGYARVIVTVPNPTGEILPGMDARVELQSQTFPNTLLVPRKAVLQVPDGRFKVYVYIPSPEGNEGRAEWRYVTQGRGNAEFVEIVENPETKMVSPGEIVLVDGHYLLAHDSAIKLVERLNSFAGDRPF